MNRFRMFLQFVLPVFLWFFFAVNAGAWEAGSVSQWYEAPSVHVGTPVTLLAQNGAGDYDDIDIHGGDDGVDYEQEVPTPAPGADQPYGDDGPEMDAPAPGPGGFDDGAPSSVRETPTEPGVGEPYGDGDPNREAPAPEDGDAYPDARREGYGDRATPSAGEPYGEEGAYPSDDGGMPQQGIAPGDENEGADGEGGGEDRGYEGGQGEDMPPYDGDYSGEGGGGEAGHDEYAPVKKKHHRKARKHRKKAKTSSKKDAPSGGIAGSIFKTLGDLTKNYQCEPCKISLLRLM